MYAKCWLVYELKFIPSRRIAKPFSSLEGMNKWIEKNKGNIIVVAKTQTIESKNEYSAKKVICKATGKECSECTYSCGNKS